MAVEIRRIRAGESRGLRDIRLRALREGSDVMTMSMSMDPR